MVPLRRRGTPGPQVSRRPPASSPHRRGQRREAFQIQVRGPGPSLPREHRGPPRPHPRPRAGPVRRIGRARYDGHSACSNRQSSAPGRAWREQALAAPRGCGRPVMRNASVLNKRPLIIRLWSREGFQPEGVLGAGCSPSIPDGGQRLWCGHSRRRGARRACAPAWPRGTSSLSRASAGPCRRRHAMRWRAAQSGGVGKSCCKIRIFPIMLTAGKHLCLP